jgi:putative endonuclease
MHPGDRQAFLRQLNSNWQWEQLVNFSLMKIYYVYILECSDGTFYTGITSNLERRIIEHISGIDQNSYTFKRRPINLKFYAEFTEPSRAIETEKQIKKWSKDKKIALINNKFEDLKNLAKKKF